MRSNLAKDSMRRGQVLAIFVGAFVILAAFAGLAFDLAVMWNSRLKMQAAADAGAMAGAAALFAGGSGNATSAAKNATSQNGFSNGQGTSLSSQTVSVTVNSPPKSGSYQSSSQPAVEVIVQQQQPTYFMKAAGFSLVQMSARAVAIVSSSGSCMFALNPSASGALDVANNAVLTASCGIQLESDSSSALIVNNNAHLTASSIGVVGGVQAGGNANMSPAPVTGIAAFPDPLSSLTAPSTGSSCTNVTVTNNSSKTLNPGYYCLTVSNNASVTLTGGTYEFDSLNLSNNSTLNGTGVTLYINSGSLNVSNNVTMNLSAPTSGSYEGIVYFQNKADTNPVNLSNNSGSTITGAIYAPGATINLGNNAYANAYSILVASQINMNNNSTINLNSNYSSLADGSPIKRVLLVE